jgi:hypothetical protein
LFRGIILDGFLKNYKPTHAILASALLFALLHGNLAQGIGAFMSGILLGWVYWKTKSIMPCIVLHLLNNSVAFIGTQFIAIEDLNKSTQDLIGNDIMYTTIYVSAICIAAGSLWILHEKIFNSESNLPPQIPQHD